MDWLKDKKNQPIVAVVAAVVIVAAAALVWLFVFRGPSDKEKEAATPAVTPAGAPRLPVPAGSQQVARPPARPQDAAATQVAQAPTGVQPMETWREDPFLPVGYRPPKRGPKPKPPIPDFPFVRFAPLRESVEQQFVPEPLQPARRMAGILINDRVYAIIESEGRSQIVQPGDMLRDRLAIVQSIEPDRVVLTTTSRPPREIVVTMAASSLPAPGTSAGPAPGPAGPGPGGPPMAGPSVGM